MILVAVFGILIIAYGFVITIAMLGWSRLSYFRADMKETHHTKVSVVIPAKNEAANIVHCVKELLDQGYPAHLLEVIVVDDASEDNTWQVISGYAASREGRIILMRQRMHAGKKQCLADAIAQCSGELVITSDADMFGRSQYWLQTIVSYYEAHRPKMIILPLSYELGSSVLNRFQVTENTALAGITGGYAGMHRAFLCNGANLAFEKEAFLSVGGYSSHSHIASGEDVFLLEDIKKAYSSKAVQYLFSRQAIAKTYSVTGIRDLFHQRLRWAYKAKYSSNKLNALIGFIVVAANLVFPALFVGLIERSPLISYLSIFAMAKVVFDFLLLFLASDFLGVRPVLVFLVPFECIYWIYATVIGLSSILVKPTWKNRKIK